MRLTNLFLLIFVLSAFAIGAAVHDSDDETINSAITNATITINNISLAESNETYANGILRITENYMKFVGIAVMETMRMGIFFGKDNPDYFEPDFISKIIKLLIWLAIISLLIQPLFYVGIFIIMSFLWLKDIIIKRKAKKFALHESKDDNNVSGVKDE